MANVFYPLFPQVALTAFSRLQSPLQVSSLFAPEPSLPLSPPRVPEVKASLNDVAAIGDFGGFSVEDGQSWQAVLAYNCEVRCPATKPRRRLQGAMAALRGDTSKGARGINALLHGPIAKSHSAGNFFATGQEFEGVRSNSSHWLTSLRAWFSGRVRLSNNDEAVNIGCRHSSRLPPAIDPVNSVKARVVLPISQR